jgi:hypothetical protein
LRLDGNAHLWLRQRGAPDETLHMQFARVVPNGDSVFNYQRAVMETRHGAVAGQARAYLRNLEIEVAIYRSAQEGRTVTL